MPGHDFLVRSASSGDGGTIAHHRAEMFRDIHGLDDAQCAAMLVESRKAIEPLLASGDYLGWFASPVIEPARVVGELAFASAPRSRVRTGATGRRRSPSASRVSS